MSAITTFGAGETHTIFETLATIRCCNCQMVFAMPSAFKQRLLESGGDFYCPNGHRQHFTDTEVIRLRQEKDRLETSLKYAKERADLNFTRYEEAQRSVAAHKGVVTKIKCRVGKGICPCCNRYFKNVHAHMTTKHPEYHKEAAS